MLVWQYRYKRLPFGANPNGDMFKRKIDKIFKDLQNVFCIADDILVIGYDSHGKDHNDTHWKVLQIFQQVNLKLKKDKCHFRCTSIPYFCKVISRHGVTPDPQKLKVLTEKNPQIQKVSSKHSLE